MNILLLSQFFSTTRGGGEYFFNLVAKNLAANNHNVWVIANKIAAEEYKNHKNIRLILVPPTLQYKGGMPPGFSDNIRYSFNAFLKGWKIIKKENIDIIHSNNFAPALAGSVLSFFTNKPHITTIHDIFSLYGKNFWKKWGEQNDVSKMNVLLAPYFEKQMIKLKHACIQTVSETTKDDLIKFGVKTPIYVIHNSVQTIQSNRTQKTNPFQFIYVGRLVFYKNLEVVFKALSIVKKTEPKVKLIIAGDGPMKNNLETLSKKMEIDTNVEFKGYVSEEEKEKLIASSSAMVFPSLYEGFGIVILEAFAQNKPVIVSDVKPLSDIVTHEQTGYVVNPFDENLWANFLLKIIKNQNQAVTIGKNGHELLNEKYGQDSMYQKIIEMYNFVHESKPKSSS